MVEFPGGGLEVLEDCRWPVKKGGGTEGKNRSLKTVIGGTQECLNTHIGGGDLWKRGKPVAGFEGSPVGRRRIERCRWGVVEDQGRGTSGRPPVVGLL